MRRQIYEGITMADAIGVLASDHARMLRLFDQFGRIRASGDADAIQTLIEIVCTEMVIHARVEEEFLYPMMRAAGMPSGSTDLADEAEVEHLVARQLIGDLEAMLPGDELYDARFKVLGAYARHHFEDEERRIFPLLRQQRQASGTGVAGGTGGTDGIAAAMMLRRDELRSEFGLPDDEYQEYGESRGT